MYSICPLYLCRKFSNADEIALRGLYDDVESDLMERFIINELAFLHLNEPALVCKLVPFFPMFPRARERYQASQLDSLLPDELLYHNGAGPEF